MPDATLPSLHAVNLAVASDSAKLTDEQGDDV